MDTLTGETRQRQKGVGTREDVFKGLATKTAGGLTRDDIIEKRIGNRILYISKKLSDKMKVNPNLIRKIRVRTRTTTTTGAAAPVENGTVSFIDTQHPTQQHPTQQHPTQQNSKPQQQATHPHPHPKTQKIHFSKDNVSVNVYYPELKGQNISALKADIEREELEEDGEMQNGGALPSPSSGKPKPFVIEDINDAIDIGDL